MYVYPQIERKKRKEKKHSFNNKRIHVSSYEEKIDAKINRNKQGFFFGGGGGAFSFIYQRYMYKCTFPDIISLQMIFLEEAPPPISSPTTAWNIWTQKAKERDTDKTREEVANQTNRPAGKEQTRTCRHSGDRSRGVTGTVLCQEVLLDVVRR